MRSDKKTNKTIVGDISDAVLAFTADRDTELDLYLVEADCIGTAAHVTMLSQLDLKPAPLSEGDCRRVIAELVEVIRRARAGRFRITQRDQDVHLAIERTLTEKLGAVGKRVHTARSRNDQVAVDLRLYGKEELLEALDATEGLASALLAFARRYRNWPMVGRTHLQPAMPSSVGLWASAYAEALLDDCILLQAAYAFNDRCPLGSAAGYGVPLAIDRDLTSRLLGFSAPIHNVLYASNARGKCEAVVLSALGHVMITLARFAEDLILFSMPEFGYFELPSGFCTGSSIMPQKRNPDVLEIVRARASIVQSQASAAAHVVQGLPGGYNRDLQEIKEPFISGLFMTRRCLDILTELVPGVVPQRDALLAGFSPEVFATDRALELVAGGMPFRDAYNAIKTGLADLEGQDPEKALQAKTHLGASAGLDFRALATRASSVKRFVRVERTRYYRKISQLLNVPYPEL
jgi:argininosuccinate lyase